MCTICRNEFIENDNIIILACNLKYKILKIFKISIIWIINCNFKTVILYNRHYFHEICIKNWFKINGSCPICRSKKIIWIYKYFLIFYIIVYYMGNFIICVKSKNLYEEECNMVI